MTDAGLAAVKVSTILVAELEKIVLGKMAAPPETAQRVGAVVDVPRLLEAGYEYVAALGQDRVIPKSPNGKPWALARSTPGSGGPRLSPSRACPLLQSSLGSGSPSPVM